MTIKLRDYEFVLKELEELGIEFVAGILERGFCSLNISEVIELQEIGYEAYEAKLEGVSVELLRQFKWRQSPERHCRGINAKGLPCGKTISQLPGRKAIKNYNPEFDDYCDFHR